MITPLRILRRAALAGALVAAGSSVALTPSALAAPIFAIAPATPNSNGYFVLKAKPGEVLERRVKITNVGNRLGTARVYAADATTGKTTGAVYLGAERPRREVAAWIRLRQRRVRLGPGESSVTTFTLRVPRDARSGQHLGGIVAANVAVAAGKRRKKAEGSFKVDVRHLTITAVQVELPGAPTRRMSIDGLGATGRRGYQSVLVDMANPGNQMIEPSLEVRVENENGDLALRRTTKLDTFLPGTRIDYPVPVLGKGLAAGTYDGTAVLRLGKKVLDRYSGSFEITDKQVAQVFGDEAGPSSPGGGGLPWKTILACLVGAMLGVALVMAVRHLRRRRAEAAARAAELARLAQEEEDRRLADLEGRERNAAEREEATAQDIRRLEASQHALTLREGAHAEHTQELELLGAALDDRERAAAHTAERLREGERRLGAREAEEAVRRTQLEQAQQLLTEREQDTAQRERGLAEGERGLEEAELRLGHRETQDATRRAELDELEQRLRERRTQVDERRVAHETEAARRAHALDDGEQRLRQRADEWTEARRRSEEAHAAARLVLQDGERRLLEDQEDFRRQLEAAKARNANTLAGRLRRRIGA